MAEAANDHEELVKVFDTDEESEAMVVRGSAGVGGHRRHDPEPGSSPGHSARRGRGSGDGAARSGRRSAADHRGVPPESYDRRGRGGQRGTGEAVMVLPSR